MISPGGGLVTITPGFILETSRDLSVTLIVVGLLVLALTVAVGLLVLTSPENDFGVLALVVVGILVMVVVVELLVVVVVLLVVVLLVVDLVVVV